MTTTEEEQGGSALLEQKIRKQVEFYFGDHNLPRDKFLQAELAKNEEGWIPLSILACFNRLKSLSPDVAVITAALKDSSLVQIKVSEDGTLIRRAIPVNQVGSNASLESSLYVKGFRAEETLEDLEAYFDSKGCEGIAAIRMRRLREDKTFKGSVFLEFTSPEAMKVAMEKIGKDKIVKTKSEYFAEKSTNNNHKKREEEEEFDDVSKNYTRGCLLKVEGVREELSHQQVKQAFSELGAPASYFEKLEDGSAWIRFQESKAAEVASTHDFIDVKTDTEVIRLTGLRVATEEEESEYYEKLGQILKAKSRNNQRGNKRKGARHNNNNRKRHLDESGEEQEDTAKQVKVDQ